MAISRAPSPLDIRHSVGVQYFPEIADLSQIRQIARGLACPWLVNVRHRVCGHTRKRRHSPGSRSLRMGGRPGRSSCRRRHRRPARRGRDRAPRVDRQGKLRCALGRRPACSPSGFQPLNLFPLSRRQHSPLGAPTSSTAYRMRFARESSRLQPAERAFAER